MISHPTPMTFFAIQQISTGLFLPAGGKGLRGHTAQRPTADRPPRLFMKEHVARRAMDAWCCGRWYEWGVDFGCNVVAGRDEGDMRVVTVNLQTVFETTLGFQEIQ